MDQNKTYLENVKRMAAPESYRRGIRYYKEGRVSPLQYMIDYQQEESLGRQTLSAVVAGSNRAKWVARLILDEEGELIGYRCDCPAAETYFGPCKHVVALAAAAADGKTPKTGKIMAPTDRQTKELIRRYAEKNAPVIRPKGSYREQVRLVPRLTVEGEYVYLEALIGAEKLYVIKSMEEFCRRMIHGERTEYGKQLTFLHRSDGFHEESRPLADFIVSKFREIETYRGNSYGYSYQDSAFSRGKRGMRLSPAAVDQFFSLTMDRQLDVSFHKYAGNEDWRCTVRDQNPRLQLLIVEGDEGGFSLELTGLNYIRGDKHLYLFSGERHRDGIIWRCDEPFTRHMEEFVSVAGRNGSSFYIARKDMGDFCSNVVSEIQDYVEFTGDVEQLYSFVPEEMGALIYLDSPRNDMITARVLCSYGDTFYDLYRNIEVTEDGDPVSEPKGERDREITRDSRQEYGLKMMMSGYFDAYDRDMGVLYFQGSNDRIYDFVRNGAAELAAHADVLATDRYKRIGASVSPKFTVGVGIESGLLNVTFDMEEFPVEELMEALAQYKQRRRYHRLKNGSFIRLEDDELSGVLRLVEGLRLDEKDLKKGRAVVPQYRAMFIDALLKNSKKIRYERDGGVKHLVREMNSAEDSDYEVPGSLEAILRDYQKTGFRWMSTLAAHGFGGILADDMGLGKTLEIIALILAAKEEYTDRLDGRKMGKQEIERQETLAVPSAAQTETEAETTKQILGLVVCPASLVLNWQEEVQRFAPELRTLSVIGSARERKQMIAEARERAETESAYDLILTSYDLLKRDADCYENIIFRYHVIDEAQYIKNHNTQNAKAVKKIRSGVRFALTGTPVENRLSELWSIFDFLMPGYLFSYTQFKEQFETAIVRDKDENALSVLSKQIAPFVLRRLKQNVLSELPEKVESVVYADMVPEQEKLYMANLAKAKLEIGKSFEDKGFETNKIVILALLTRLRQICCHPTLCYEEYAEGSGKLETCLELIGEAVDGGHKILLFSQFTSMLDVLRQKLTEQGIATFLLTGKTSKEERRSLVERFNDAACETPVFLISLKAGGTGLNLTAADTVIHYDPWWNLAAQNQATDRTHRIGQKRSVQVYKLIAKDTIEEKILKLQEEKQGLADAIIQENETSFSSLSKEELLALL